MERFCENSNCKKKLREYRDLIGKLYDEIDSVENDLKERDEFLQQVIKARNNFKSEAKHLKKRNDELVKENDSLIEKSVIDEKSIEDLEKTKSELKVCQNKLKVIEEEFDIDYDLAAKLKNDGVKQKQELDLAKKLIADYEKGKAISTKLIKNLQNDNEELKKTLGIEKDKCEEEARVFKNSEKEYQDCLETFEKKVVDQEVIIKALEMVGKTPRSYLISHSF